MAGFFYAFFLDGEALGNYWGITPNFLTPF